MKLLIVSFFIVAATADRLEPQQPLSNGYAQPAQPTYFQPAPQPAPQPTYQQPAQEPVVTRNLYLYQAPKQEVTYGPAPALPAPKVPYNFVFVRTAAGSHAVKPIVAPAPQQKTLVYL